jgi:hypothetical protein
VSEKTILDVIRLEGILQQGVVLQVDHAKAQVVACTPVGMSFLQCLGIEGFSLNGGSGSAVGAEGILF